MSGQCRARRTRRGVGVGAALCAAAALAAALAGTLATGAAQPGSAAQPGAGAGAPGPRFRADGPEAEAFGRADGYPACQAFDYATQQRCRIGALSAFDTLFPARTIKAPAVPSPLRRSSEPVVRYTYAGQSHSLDEYLDRHPVTGFLVAKGDTILVERYQYARTEAHRLASFSMAKTIVGLLVGIAAADGAIRSIDDPAETYAPALRGTEYGKTPIRALLLMASGVSFQEDYSDRSSDIAKLAFATLGGQDPAGSAAALRQFNTRAVPPGQRFSYSSAESLVLGLVVAGATRRTVADYASEKLWQPLGAEADATWNIDATGQEVTYAYVNAVLRDWARLGLMLAHDGAWNGRSIVPRSWVVQSTTASHTLGYGYQVWLLRAPGRTFALRGLRGQSVLVDPDARLVMVQTAARPGLDAAADQEMFSLWAALRTDLR